jgi:hypothetical protein
MSMRVTWNKKIHGSHHTKYMGKRRRVEGRVSKFLFRSIRISGTRFILRGVGL